MTLVIYCFIECVAIYLTRFWLFLLKYPILERQISGEEYESSIGTKISKTYEVSWGSKN